ncbi:MULTISPECIES: type II toxin-antitoxin system RelB/DinJ family antitoxin [Commensalibacter]|uniref:type II toxin-antitoxin system RelB/DinJ family antitoxin n=1 Tax=Commensalibacter TaxID=1079922 RepID=UPI0018DE78F5|nr:MULTISPECIES: type II toxin-antitoxin system RelB/DinJ family antitoxin [Commensalibacter]
MDNHLVQARIDKTIKNQAVMVLSGMKLTISDAIYIFLTRIAKEKQLPFEPIIPNKTTIMVM